jgi:hypothetical protein
MGINPIYLVVMALAVGSFAFGMIFNLRRGDAYMRWMQDGMPKVAERTTLRWLGSTVAELTLVKTRKPFRQLAILLVFEPRDLFPMWGWLYLFGRRDTLILRGQLQSPVRFDLELADPRFWTGRQVIQDLTKRGWESREYNGLTLLAPKGLLDLAQHEVERLSVPCAALASQYGRFGLRRQNSQFEFHLRLPDRQVNSSQFFEAFKSLGNAALMADEH